MQVINLNTCKFNGIASTRSSSNFIISIIFYMKIILLWINLYLLTNTATFWNLYFSYYLLIKEICLLVSMMPFIPFRRRMQQGSVVVVFSGVIGQHMYPSNVELQNPVKIQIRCIWGMILQHIFLLQPIIRWNGIDMHNTYISYLHARPCFQPLI